MIILLGTSHVSKRSERMVEDAILHADVVAIELDPGRAEALLSGKRASFREIRQALGLRAAIMASVLRKIQESVGERLGVVPGLEMKAALRVAEEHKKQVALIDREVSITLERLSKNFGWPEMKQLAKDFFRRRSLPVHPDVDLVTTLLAEMKHTYPRVYGVMVAERDVYMARQLVALERYFAGKTVLAVVGMGHVPGLQRHITNLNPEAEVRVWSSPAKNA